MFWPIKRPAISVIVRTQVLPRQPRRAQGENLMKTPMHISKNILSDETANIQEPRNLQTNASTSNLALMTSDPEQILRGTHDLYFNTTFQNPQNAL